jgi:hypothetical protein
VDSSIDPKEVERLYGLPRDEFLKARDALAKDLRESGDREAAEEAKGLRKPTVAAWAVNQLARRSAAEMERLLEAGDELRRLQRKAASGVTREELRAATAARRKLVDSLVGAADDILREAGHPVSRQTLDHVSQTLEATAVDETAQDLVRRGVLEKELAAPVGFGDLSALSIVAAPPRERGSRAERAAPRPKPSPKQREREAREREREARRQERAERLARDADEADAEAGRLREEAAEAERAAIKARRAADRAEVRAQQARERAEVAGKELGP